jgi:hypothetical protein
MLNALHVAVRAAVGRRERAVASAMRAMVEAMGDAVCTQASGGAIHIANQGIATACQTPLHFPSFKASVLTSMCLVAPMSYSAGCTARRRHGHARLEAA